MDKKQHNNSPTCFETIWSGFLAPRSSILQISLYVFLFWNLSAQVDPMDLLDPTVVNRVSPNPLV